MAIKLIAAVGIILSTTIFPLAMGLTVEITPQRYTEASTGKVTIGCVLDPLDGCGEKAPMVLGLGKDGETQLAFVQQPSSIDFYIDPAKKYHAQGYLDKDTYTGYLNVSVSSPDHSDSGRYTCVIFCRYDTGVSQGVQASENLSVEKLDVHGLLKELVGKMSIVEELVGKTSVVDNLVAKMSIIEDKLKTQDIKDAVLSQQLSTLEETTRNQSRQMESFVDKVTYSSAFATSLTNSVSPSAGQVLIFPKISMNLGQDYDGTTGVYTAPVSGLYFFHLILAATSNGGWAEVEIKANDVVLVNVGVGDNDYHVQSSGSSLADLQKGDTVKAVIRLTWKLYHARVSSMFTGYLIKSF